MRLRRLEDIINKKGITYRLVERTDLACIYTREFEDKIEAYEVFMTRLCKPHPKSTEQCKMYDMIEKFPRDEEFGKRAWTYQTLERAMVRYRSIHDKKASGNGKSGTDCANGLGKIPGHTACTSLQRG